MFLLRVTEAEFTSNKEFKKLCDDYWKWRLSDMPQYATRIGIHDYNTELNDMSEEAYEKRLEKSHYFLERANALEPSLTSENDINNMKALKYELQIYIGSWEFKGFYLAINYMEGPHKYDSQLFSYMPRKSREDFGVILKRLEKLPRQIDQIIDLLKAGVRNNITLYSVSLKNLNESLGKYVVEDPELSPFYDLFKDGLQPTFEHKDILNKSLAVIKTQVSPAYDKLRKYILNEYVPRKNMSITNIRNGKQFYEACIWFHTSKNKSTEDLRISGRWRIINLERYEREKIRFDELPFNSETSLRNFSDMVREKKPENFFNSSADLLKEFERIVYEEIPSRLADIFKRVPKRKLIVDGVENPNDEVRAHYEFPNLDGSNPGKLILNTFNPQMLPKYDMLTLALHEGKPGHHFQISHILESQNLPHFRRFRDTSNTGMAPSIFPQYAFIVEGWSSYAESLWFDMNFSENNLYRFSHYSKMIHRACALMVDVGLHAFGWTREEAIEYMFTRTTASKLEIENEIDRYITWPGQALSYMIGEEEILEFRDNTDEGFIGLKEIFDIKEFHEVVLNSFQVLDTLWFQIFDWAKKMKEIQTLYEKYWNWKLENKPEYAFKVGLLGYDGKLNDLSEEAYENRHKMALQFSDLGTIYLRHNRNEDKSFNYKLFKHELNAYLEFYKLKGFYLPLNFLEGPQNYATVFLKMIQLETQKDYEVMLNVMRNIPKKIDQIIHLMKKGMENNITNHESSMKALKVSLGEYVVEKPEDSPFFSYFDANFPSNFTSNQIQDLQQQARSLISNEIVPAYKKLKDFVSNEYVSRSEISVRTIKEGDLFYKGCIKFYTGTDMTAEEIHQIGLEEVERIEKEIHAIGQEMGFGNINIRQFSDHIREDPNNYYKNSEEIIERYRYIARDIIQPKLSLIFNTVPNSTFEIKGSYNPSGTKVYYSDPSLFGTRPGTLWINTYDPKTLPKYDMLTLCLHGGNPGHHLKLSFNYESLFTLKYWSKETPNFRKVIDVDNFGTVPSNFPFYTYFTEGWASYAETLGFDIGLFNDTLDRYGHYSMKLLRACGLVVDTGIHALGWTKEEALNYMIKYTSLTESKLKVEIERYITWPGKALSYMIGEMKIRNLRKKSEIECGRYFDLKEFHEVVLSSLGTPDLLDEQVRKWIEETLAAQIYLNGLWKLRLDDHPQLSTSVGEHKNDKFLDELSHNKHHKRYSDSSDTLRWSLMYRAKPANTNADKINFKVLRNELQTYMNGYTLNGHYLVVNSLEGPHRYLETLFRRMPKKTEEDYLNIIERMKKIPQQIDQIIDLMINGIESDTTYHETSMKGLNESLAEFIVDNARESPFYRNFFAKDFPKNFSRKQTWRLQMASKDVIRKEVVPAFAKLHYFVTENYLPRENISIITIPNGQEFYQALILFHTSTNDSAQEIHDIGLKEVERIEKKMLNVISQMGLQNTSVKEYNDKIRNDPQNYHKTSDDLLNDVKDLIEKIYPRLNKLFHKIPKTKLEVVGERNPHQTFARYEFGSHDGTEPGKFVISTYNLNASPKYGLLALALHEGVPGHHLQSSHSIEAWYFAGFRKYIDHNYLGTCPSRFPVYGYFTEGWALYAESLGFDMQLFDSPSESYGYYSSEIFDACRLVVDTGIHALGWTKEQALEYMLRYTAYPRVKLQNEIDRYITWPGQALSYKMGELKIRQLRTEAEEKLGSKFNIKDFHQIVLDSLGPMEIVEEEVRKWIESH